MASLSKEEKTIPVDVPATIKRLEELIEATNKLRLHTRRLKASSKRINLVNAFSRIVEYRMWLEIELDVLKSVAEILAQDEKEGYTTMCIKATEDDT